jgi:DNA polymerase-3 subunit epsilon
MPDRAGTLPVVGAVAVPDGATPLAQVTFCAVDLETTGGSPASSAITEVGAVKYVGGERVGSFQTLVDPGLPVPRFITHLTGLDDLALAGAPPIEAVLPALAEFLQGTVFVAHNARFDFGFLNAGLRRLGYEPLPPPPVCTAKLAKRIVWPDVRNVRLATLAEHFRVPIRPTHRALPDAEACAAVLHCLFEAGGRLGILTLADLHAAVTARGRPHYGKIGLADALPHAPGVYLFRGREGRVLYVGKSTDLRTRVRSYFYGDDRKRVADLLAATREVEGRTAPSELEALVTEARLIRLHEPPYNRRGRTWRRFVYLKVDLADAFPRFTIVRRARAGDAVLGPFPTRAAAQLAREAIEDVVPIRRCTRRMRATTRFAPCALAGMGRCPAPCDGGATPERYGELVRSLLTSLLEPDGLLAALEARLARLVGQERFEEAGLFRDRIRALADALARARVDRWLTAGRIELREPGGGRVLLERGWLVGPEDQVDAPDPGPCPPERADELAAVRSWVCRARSRLVAADPPLAEPVAGGRALADLLARLRAPHPAGAR